MEKINKLWRYLALLGIIIVTFIREPDFFLRPRIWAEEGSCYFASAYYYAQDGQWYKGIFNIMFGGYLNLWANISATIAANCVSLENVPYVTVLSALLVQLIPFAIILWSESAFWRSPLRKTGGICVLLFAPLSGEVWLNSINSMSFFSLATFLLLMEDSAATSVKRWCYRILIMLGGLTGPGSCIFSPLFLLRAYLDKNKERFIQGVILSACAVIQVLLVFLRWSDYTEGSNYRFGLDLSSYILSLWTQSVGLLFLGLDNAWRIADYVLNLHSQNNFLYMASAPTCAIVLGMIFVFFSKGLPNNERLLLLGAYFLLTFVSFYGAITDNDTKFSYIMTGYGQRYYFVPNIIFLLLLLAGIKKPFRIRSCAATGMLLVSLAFGISEYRTTLFRGDDWPQWNEEVRKWRENPEHKIAIWPPNWYVKLRR